MPPRGRGLRAPPHPVRRSFAQLDAARGVIVRQLTARGLLRGILPRGGGPRRILGLEEPSLSRGAPTPLPPRQLQLPRYSAQEVPQPPPAAGGGGGGCAAGKPPQRMAGCRQTVDAYYPPPPPPRVSVLDQVPTA